MSNRRGQTRHITQLLNGGASLAHVGEYTIRIAFSDQPGIQHIFTKAEYPDFLGLVAPEGLAWRCRKCRQDYAIVWNGENPQEPHPCFRKYHKEITETLCSLPNCNGGTLGV